MISTLYIVIYAANTDRGSDFPNLTYIVHRIRHNSEFKAKISHESPKTDRESCPLTCFEIMTMVY